MWQRRGHVHLPRTGQTTSYRAGDDGAYEAGWPGSARFVDNGNNTVFDRATHLTWIKDPSAMGSPFNAERTWDQAIDDCAALSYAGFGDWRLPNFVELTSIIDFSEYAPAIHSVFANAHSGYYWTATTHSGDTAKALRIAFQYGGVSFTAAKTYEEWVRPVRGGRING